MKKKITADLKCLACGRVWATTQDAKGTPFARSATRTASPEFARLDKVNPRCPRCHGTLWLEITAPEEYEVDRLMGA